MMFSRTMFKGKIHRAKVTEANLNYMGSITIDAQLLEAADILPYEQVSIVNVTTGARFETYTISGERGSGVICLNGGAARLAQPGDIVIIMSYVQVPSQELSDFNPTVVFVDTFNQILQVSGEHQITGANRISES
jgi:aspartate 1-decarboxylase